MGLPQGINFRLTAGYVTDTSPATYEISDVANYPRTTPQGVNVGYETVAGNAQTRDRNAGNDARLAGLHRSDDDGNYDYRIDLPASGSYLIRAALGDAVYATGVFTQVLDGATVKATISGSTSAGQRFLDATGAERTNLTWPSDNASITHAFASTILRFRTTRSGTNVGVSHTYVESAGGAPAGHPAARRGPNVARRVLGSISRYLRIT